MNDIAGVASGYRRFPPRSEFSPLFCAGYGMGLTGAVLVIHSCVPRSVTRAIHSTETPACASRVKVDQKGFEFLL
jgi:hypothetical protein